MSSFKSFFAIALIGIAVTPAFATTGFTPSSTESSFVQHAMPASGITRAQVLQQLSDWRKNPVTADGWREVGGELGWVQEPHKYVFQNGSFQHADTMRHDTPKPSNVLTQQERATGRGIHGGN